MRLVILDWDGTLVDSLGAHFESYERAAEKLDVEVDMEKVRNMAGRTAPEIIRETFKTGNDDEAERIMKVKDDIYIKELWKRVKPFPGAQEIIDDLKDKFMFAVATSSDISLVRPVLDKFNWYYKFIEILGRDDIERGKPDPEILLKISERTGIPPKEAMYIGDSVHDMTAAKRAGMMAVGIPTGVHTKKQLRDAGADEIFENLFETRDFLERL